MRVAVRGAAPWLRLRGQAKSILPVPPILRCLVFHDIQPDQEGGFRAQLARLREHFEIVDLAEFGRRWRGEVRNNRDAVLLTFDDAYATASRIGQILSEQGVRGVFFVPTGFIACRSREEQENYIYRHLFYGLYPPGGLPSNLRPMGWEKIRELAAAGHYIGCHTESHPPLHILDTPEKRERELVASARLLAERVECPIEAFAAPFGTVESFSRESLAMLAANYRYVFTSVRGNNQAGTTGALFRETVMVDDSPEYVLLQAAGGLGWFYWRARRQMRQLLSEPDDSRTVR